MNKPTDQLTEAINRSTEALRQIGVAAAKFSEHCESIFVLQNAFKDFQALVEANNKKLTTLVFPPVASTTDLAAASGVPATEAADAIAKFSKVSADSERALKELGVKLGEMEGGEQ